MSSNFGQQSMKNLDTAKYITDKGSVVQSFKVNSHETNCLELLIFHNVTKSLHYDGLSYHIYQITYILYIFCTGFTERCPFTGLNMVLKHLTGKQSPHLIYVVFIFFSSFKWNLEDPSRGVLRKRCSETMQQIYRRTSMPKCGFNKIGKKLVNLLHIFRTLFPKNTSGGLLLEFQKRKEKRKKLSKTKNSLIAF